MNIAVQWYSRDIRIRLFVIPVLKSHKTAVQAFIGKASAALGTMVGGLTLDFIEFPVQTAVGEVPQQAIFAIGLIYGPILALLYFAAVGMLYFYKIDRKTHLANIATLEEQEN